MVCVKIKTLTCFSSSLLSFFKQEEKEESKRRRKEKKEKEEGEERKRRKILLSRSPVFNLKGGKDEKLLFPLHFFTSLSPLIHKRILGTGSNVHSLFLLIQLNPKSIRKGRETMKIRLEKLLSELLNEFKIGKRIHQ